MLHSQALGTGGALNRVQVWRLPCMADHCAYRLVTAASAGLSVAKRAGHFQLLFFVAFERHGTMRPPKTEIVMASAVCASPARLESGYYRLRQVIWGRGQAGPF